MKPISVTLKRDISERAILDSLTNWFDSGLSNFWVSHTSRRPYRAKKNTSGVYGDDYELVLPIMVYVHEDCAIDGDNAFKLDRAAIVRGLNAMAERYPKLFNDEFPVNPDDYNGDANSADVFVQCCLFGNEEFA